jgi:replicative DNA helicase
MDARMRGDHTVGTVETGFVDLDRLTGGLHASEFIVLAARPSMGKTALAMNIAEHVVFNERKPVLFVSLEMAAIELIERLLCSVARVNGHRLRNNTISTEDRRRLTQKASEISSAPLFIDDSASRTVAEIAGAARRIKRKQNDLGLIVIDYLQLITADNPSDPRQEQVAGMARRLKKLSRELEVPILCLSQLNRQTEDARDHQPRLSHLRESGAIEQDADVVMFVHREEYFLRGDDRAAVEGEAQLIIAKQRNGPTDTVNLVWRKEFTRFENIAPERHSEFDGYEG